MTYGYCDLWVFYLEKNANLEVFGQGSPLYENLDPSNLSRRWRTIKSVCLNYGKDQFSGLAKKEMKML